MFFTQLKTFSWVYFEDTEAGLRKEKELKLNWRKIKISLKTETRVKLFVII